MADVKISGLPAASAAEAANEFEINEAGVSKKVTGTQIKAFASADSLPLTGGTLTGAQDWATGTAIASASTVNLNTATGNRVHITGTTAISAVTLTRGPRTVIFDGILTLTHHATVNNLPGAANITTAAGDRAIYESDGTTIFCVSYIKASGASIVSSAAEPILFYSLGVN